MNKNPHALADGSPKPREEFQFWQWAVENDKERINNLPESEKKKVLASQKNLADKMDS